MSSTKSITYVFPEDQHNDLVAQVYQARGYEPDESAVAAECAGVASKYGIKTHAALKALHLEHLFGTGCGLAKPGAKVE